MPLDAVLSGDVLGSVGRFVVKTAIVALVATFAIHVIYERKNAKQLANKTYYSILLMIVAWNSLLEIGSAIIYIVNSGAGIGLSSGKAMSYLGGSFFGVATSVFITALVYLSVGFGVLKNREAK